MTISAQQIQEFAVYLHQEEKSPATIEKYLRDVRNLAAFNDGAEITKEPVLSWKQALIQQGYSNHHRELSLVKEVLFYSVTDDKYSDPI